jgi:Flp pilus assembly protein TadB
MAARTARAYRRDVTRHQRPAEVHTITNAQASHDADLSLRMRKYLISMGVRTLCFVLAVVFDGPLRWVFAAAAIVLPYVAVVIANAGPRRVEGQPGYVPEQRALEGDRRDRLGS